MPEEFEPVTIGDLITGNHGLTAHCRNCGHWKSVNPLALPLPPYRPIPALEGAFKCTICGSRNTCAMPDYNKDKANLLPTAAGWILPPAQ